MVLVSVVVVLIVLGAYCAGAPMFVHDVGVMPLCSSLNSLPQFALDEVCVGCTRACGFSWNYLACVELCVQGATLES